jgi:hypothetical protein
MAIWLVCGEPLLYDDNDAQTAQLSLSSVQTLLSLPKSLDHAYMYMAGPVPPAVFITGHPIVYLDTSVQNIIKIVYQNHICIGRY